MQMQANSSFLTRSAANFIPKDICGGDPEPCCLQGLLHTWSALVCSFTFPFAFTRTQTRTHNTHVNNQPTNRARGKHVFGGWEPRPDPTRPDPSAAEGCTVRTAANQKRRIKNFRILAFQMDPPNFLWCSGWPCGCPYPTSHPACSRYWLRSRWSGCRFRFPRAARRNCKQ